MDFTSFHEFVRRKLARSFALPSRLSGEDFLRDFLPSSTFGTGGSFFWCATPGCAGIFGDSQPAACVDAGEPDADEPDANDPSSTGVPDGYPPPGASSTAAAAFPASESRSPPKFDSASSAVTRSRRAGSSASTPTRFDDPPWREEGLDGTGSTTSTAKSLEHPNDRDRARPVALGGRDSSRSNSRRDADPPRVRLAGRTERELPPNEDHHIPHTRAKSHARRSSSADRRGSSVDRRRRTRRAPPNCRT